jgi:hypothetical protein
VQRSSAVPAQVNVSPTASARLERVPPIADVALADLASAKLPLNSPLRELQRRHHQVRGAVAPRGLELQHDLASDLGSYAFVGQRRTCDVAVQLLQRL